MVTGFVSICIQWTLVLFASWIEHKGQKFILDKLLHFHLETFAKKTNWIKSYDIKRETHLIKSAFCQFLRVIFYLSSFCQFLWVKINLSAFCQFQWVGLVNSDDKYILVSAFYISRIDNPASGWSCTPMTIVQNKYTSFMLVISVCN